MKRIRELLRRGRALKDEGEAETARAWNYRFRLGWIAGICGGLILVVAGGLVLSQINQEAAGAALLSVGIVVFAAGVPLFFAQNALSVRIKHYERGGRGAG